MGTDAIIWVLDGSDRSRLEESRVELHRLLAENELKGIYLVWRNKTAPDIFKALISLSLQIRAMLARI